ncbi:Lysocardiolipin acyltransferase 1 [Schistosoma japonicum]|nr:Lysocardiolipin acyltransferase 1 [Schistosoma japonicum]
MRFPRSTVFIQLFKKLGDALPQKGFVLGQYTYQAPLAAALMVTVEVDLSNQRSSDNQSPANVHLLIFPEGTDLNKIALERSDSYAVNNNLPYLRYTLHPRITGFLNLVKLIGLDHLTEVYDVTVAYPDILPSPEINLIYGQVPHEVHYLVRRFTLNDLLNNGGNNSNNQKLDNEINDTLSKWLQNRWLEKEKSLKEYYGWFLFDLTIIFVY